MDARAYIDSKESILQSTLSDAVKNLTINWRILEKDAIGKRIQDKALPEEIYSDFEPYFLKRLLERMCEYEKEGEIENPDIYFDSIRFHTNPENIGTSAPQTLCVHCEAIIASGCTDQLSVIHVFRAVLEYLVSDEHSIPD